MLAGYKPKEKTPMPFEYLSVMAQNSAPKPPRVLVSPSKPAWQPVRKSGEI
jgi:hypothetical protein